MCCRIKAVVGFVSCNGGLFRVIQADGYRVPELFFFSLWRAHESVVTLSEK